MFKSMAFLLVILLAFPASTVAQNQKQDLSVALFAYTPDASTAAKALETAFERQYGDIDLDVDLIDPYSIGLGPGEMFDDKKVAEDLGRYDIVEIDLCRLDDLRKHLDKLPVVAQRLGTPYAEPVRDALAKPSVAEYVSPHWACGNLLVSWSTANLMDVDTFAEVCGKMSGTAGAAVLVDFYGGTTLGEYYADWLADHYGIEQARQKLKALGSRVLPMPTPEQLNDKDWMANPLSASDLDAQAVKDFKAMVSELHADYFKQLGRFHYATDAYPRRFAVAAETGSLLVGYSERLYFVGLSRSLDPTREPEKVTIQANEVDVRPLTFGGQAGTTPVWIDGFVVPAGKLAPKQGGIEKFLVFASSPKAYAIFRQPTGFGPAAHLLPVSAVEYSGDAIKDCPALPKFRDALARPFVLDDSDVWRGIKYAGELLEVEVKAAAAARP